MQVDLSANPVQVQSIQAHSSATRVLARIEKLPVQKLNKSVFTIFRQAKEAHGLISGTWPSWNSIVLDGVNR